MFLATGIAKANAGQIGPTEGGPCDSCSVWIEPVTPEGGQINSSLRSSMLSGSKSYEPETRALAHANCLSRGFSGETILSAPSRLPGIWIYRQAQNFRCTETDPVLPQIFIESISTSGGSISTKESGESEVKSIADANCSSRALGSSNLEAPSWTGHRYHYKFECHQTEREASRTTSKDNVTSSNQTDSSDSSRMTIEDAKSKCASIGFKPKTEKFGNCVLKLTK